MCPAQSLDSFRGEHKIAAMPSLAVASPRSSSRLEAIPPLRRGGPVATGAAHSSSGADRHGRSDPAPAPSLLERRLTGVRVLVVDDDADVLELFAVALSVCGADVFAAGSAREALALTVQTRPHVVVSDIAMMSEDGYWLVREIQRLPDREVARVPVLAATAYGREHPRQRVLAAGFTELVQKPVDPDVLCRLVARLAGR
jgi:CheY-like chemotaxis protein